MKYIKKDKGSSVNLSGSNIYKTELSNKTIGDRVYTTNSSIQNNIEIGLNHLKEETGSQQDVIPDLVLVSSRHLLECLTPFMKKQLWLVWSFFQKN